jgi:hypothetical protein
MNIAIAKERIKERISEVEEEWLLVSIQRLLGMSDSDEANTIASYESSLTPMSKTDLQNRALQSEQDIKQGRLSDLESLLNDN